MTLVNLFNSEFNWIELCGSFYDYNHINANKNWIDGLQYKDLINFIIAQ